MKGFIHVRWQWLHCQCHLNLWVSSLNECCWNFFPASPSKSQLQISLWLFSNFAGLRRDRLGGSNCYGSGDPSDLSDVHLPHKGHCMTRGVINKFLVFFNTKHNMTVSTWQYGCSLRRSRLFRCALTRGKVSDCSLPCAATLQLKTFRNIWKSSTFVALQCTQEIPQ